MAHDSKTNQSYRWAWVKAIRRSALPPSARAVAVALADYGGSSGVACPTAPSLAADTGYCRRTVQHCLNELEAEGWIVAEQERHQGHTPHWHLVIPSTVRSAPVTLLHGEKRNEKRRSAREAQKRNL